MKIIKKLTKKLILVVLALLVIGVPLTYLNLLNSPTVKADWFACPECNRGNDNWVYQKGDN